MCRSVGLDRQISVWTDRCGASVGLNDRLKNIAEQGYPKNNTNYIIYTFWKREYDSVIHGKMIQRPYLQNPIFISHRYFILC